MRTNCSVNFHRNLKKGSPKVRSGNISGNWLPFILETSIKFRYRWKVFDFIYWTGAIVKALLHWAIFLATCLAIFLRHDPLRCVICPEMNMSRNFVVVVVATVAREIAQCNSTFTRMLLKFDQTILIFLNVILARSSKPAKIGLKWKAQ